MESVQAYLLNISIGQGFQITLNLQDFLSPEYTRWGTMLLSSVRLMSWELFGQYKYLKCACMNISCFFNLIWKSIFPHFLTYGNILILTLLVDILLQENSRIIWTLWKILSSVLLHVIKAITVLCWPSCLVKCDRIQQAQQVSLH